MKESTEFTQSQQRQLFEEPARERQRELDRIADQITAKFGNQAIRHGASLENND